MGSVKKNLVSLFCPITVNHEEESQAHEASAGQNVSNERESDSLPQTVIVFFLLLVLTLGGDFIHSLGSRDLSYGEIHLE